MLEDRRREDSYRFRPGESPQDGIGRVAEAQLGLTTDLLEGAPDQEHPGDAVHEARKALKRIRALLRVSAGVLPDQRIRDENRVLRDAGRALSGTRDAQVLLDTLDGLSTRYREILREHAWSGLRASLATAARESGGLDSEQAASLARVLSDARSRAGRWAPPRDGRPSSLGGGFKRVYRRGRAAYAAARSHPTRETLHELRKRAKDLWHGAQLLEPIANGRMKEVKQAAHHLADLLGEDHDLTILREHAEQHPDLASPIELELLVAVIGSRQQELRREAMSCGAELYEEKPKRLLARVALS